MKKKIKELTIQEMDTICKSHRQGDSNIFDCGSCPIHNPKGSCVMYDKIVYIKYRTDYMETEVEVKE